MFKFKLSLASIWHLAQQTWLVIKRFPLTAVVAVLGTVTALILVDIDNETRQQLYIRILMTCTLGFPLLTALTLFAERSIKKIGHHWLLQAAGVGFLIVYFLLLPANLEYAPESHFLRFTLFCLAFLSAITFAPFIKKLEINGFWQYNKTLFIRLFITGVYVGTLFVGLAISLASIDFLFGVNIKEEFYLRLWISLVGFVATTFFLADMPTKVGQLEKKQDVPTGIRVFSQYILTPLLIVYAAILIAYAIKILYTGVWPKGQVSYFVMAFGTVGIITNALLYPHRDQKQHQWVKVFSTVFFATLILLSLMLFWAIWLRLSQYGLTEPRYYVVAIGLWFVGLSIYFLRSRDFNIKVVPISFFVIILLSSFGPWEAIGSSLRYQSWRFTNLLNKYELLVEGKIVPNENEVTNEDLKNISSVIDYLYHKHGLSALQPWFSEDLKVVIGQVEDGNNYRYDSPRKLMEVMGLKYVEEWSRYQEDRYLRFATNQAQSYPIASFSSVIQIMHVGNFKDNYNVAQEYDAGTIGTLSFILDEESNLQIKRDKKTVTAIDLKKLRDRLVKEENEIRDNLPLAELTINQQTPLGNLRLYIEYLNLEKQEETDEWQITSLSGLLLLP